VQGKASSKKHARMSAAIQAVNYLHQTGNLNKFMRLAEKAKQKKPEWQPPQKAHKPVGMPRGRFLRQRGYSRGRGAAGRGGHFVGLNKSGAATAMETSFVSDQYYYQQSGFTSDDSYTTANSSFTTSFMSPHGYFQGSSAAYSSLGTTPGSIGKPNMYTRFNTSVGSQHTGLTAPNSWIGRGMTWARTRPVVFNRFHQ